MTNLIICEGIRHILSVGIHHVPPPPKTVNEIKPPHKENGDLKGKHFLIIGEDKI